MAVPIEQRAWTHYRAALMKLPTTPLDVVSDESTFPALKPGDRAWAPAVKFIQENQAQLETIRRAARLEHMGYRMTNRGDPELEVARNPDLAKQREFEHRLGMDTGEPAEAENPELVGVLLPHLALMRELARWFAFDARYAASVGDGTRVREDLLTLVGMARHSSYSATHPPRSPS